MNRHLGTAWLLSAALALVGCASGGDFARPSASEKNQQAAKLHTQLAQEYFRKGQLDVARDRVQRALQLDPGSSDAHSVAALLHDQIADYPRAELHYRRAAELKPKDGGVNNNYANFLCSRGRFDEADDYFRVAIADPYYRTPEVALANAGTCAQRAGRNEAAEQYLRRALERDPNYAAALLPMAKTLTARGDHLRARAFLQRHEAVAAPSADALALGLDIEEALGDHRAAAEYRKRLLDQFPRSQQARSLEERQ
jgi:type IV pilus assembly protein PilF